MIDDILDRYSVDNQRLRDEIVKLRAERDAMKSAIMKYLSHQLGHAESYRVLRESLPKVTEGV